MILDASDVPRWQITLEPGKPHTFAAEVTLPGGTPVGRASADGGLLNPFPRIELTDPTGVRLGHATSKGARSGGDHRVGAAPLTPTALRVPRPGPRGPGRRPGR